MKTYYSFIVIAFLLILGQNLVAQSVETRGRISNSIYMYENQKQQVDGTTGATKIARFYQTVRFQAKFKKLANLKINLAGRALTESGDNDLTDEQRFKAYQLSISGNNLFSNRLDFEIGRQFLHPGVVLGSLDGANVVVRPIKNLEWQIYGGVETHLLNALKIYEADDATVYGSALTYRNIFQTNIQAVYLQKTRNSENQWQIAGLNLINRSLNNLTILMQGHYDLVNERFHRLYLSSTYRFPKKLSVNAYLKQQYPQVYGDSYFQIFNVSQYQLAGISLAYALTDVYSINGSFQGVQLEEGYGNRMILSLNDRNGSLGMVYETGDLGEQLGFMLDYGYEILPDLITSLSVDYSRYRFEEIFDYENQLANAVGVAYNFTEHWRFKIEYQWLNNKFLKSDQRILNHIHFIW
jgi:opacity protein-like surface antigen